MLDTEKFKTQMLCSRSASKIIRQASLSQPTSLLNTCIAHTRHICYKLLGLPSHLLIPPPIHLASSSHTESLMSTAIISIKIYKVHNFKNTDNGYDNTITGLRDSLLTISP